MADLRNGSYASVAARVALAAVVGGGLACAVLVGSFLVVGLVPCHAGGFGCLGYVVPILVGSLVIAAIAAWPALWALRTHRTTSAYDREITGAGVPLLAPELPGYDIHNAHADPYARTLHYELTPRGPATAASDYERAGRTISVHVASIPPRFAPPARCNVDDAYRPDQPCTAVGPDLWRRTTDGPEVDYLARRGTVLVNVSQGGGFIDEALLRRAVTGLAPRPAADFRPR